MLKKLRSICIFLAILLCLYAYFHVDGSEIEGVKDISEDCTVTIAKYPWMEWENRTEYVLDGSQIQSLKALLMESSFTRNPTAIVTGNFQMKYYITVEYAASTPPLILDCTDNKYILVTNDSDQFSGKFLNVNNPSWQKSLEELLQASAP